MGEIIVRVDPETGEAIGEVSKELAHRDGFWHATIHVWILDDMGRLLFQHRSPFKVQYPGLWDTSVAGHLRRGEDGTREVAEEVGADVQLCDMTFLGLSTIDVEVPEGRNRERPRMYLWKSGRSLDSFRFSDGEVTELASISVEDLGRVLVGETVRALIFDGADVASGELSGQEIVQYSQGYWDMVLEGLDSVGA
jgi:isopentenyl-diphosphate Delta-isomerase